MLIKYVERAHPDSHIWNERTHDAFGFDQQTRDRYYEIERLFRLERVRADGAEGSSWAWSAYSLSNRPIETGVLEEGDPSKVLANLIDKIWEVLVGRKEGDKVQKVPFLPENDFAPAGGQDGR